MYIPLTFEGALAKCLYASGGFYDSFISGSDQYIYHYFTGSGNYTFEVINGTLDAQVLVVGGGGGGARGSLRAGGGGGGGVNYISSQKLYTGTYSVYVGSGGAGGATDENGLNGVSSSFLGGPNNLSIIAGGGYGGYWENTGFQPYGGGASGTPTQFSGSLNGGTTGGGGGGASAAASGQTGADGLTISIGNYGACYGAGGGGGASSTYGFGGCEVAGGEGFGGHGGRNASNVADGANNFGGGGGGAYAGRAGSASGGSGIVVIQYKVNTYCKNFFNTTGSCGCIELTFDTTDNLNFFPQYTGSYLYTPCGKTSVESGSIQAYFPTTVCASSGTFFKYARQGYPYSGSGFVSTGSQCVSQSAACTTQQIFLTGSCASSSVVTFYSGNGGTNSYYYIPKTGSVITIGSQSASSVTYQCVTSGSYPGSPLGWPYGTLQPGGKVYPTAACSTITINTNSTKFNYTPCGGTDITNATVSIGQKICIDTNRPTSTTSGILVTYSVGGTCLSGSFDTGSCGCP